MENLNFITEEFSDEYSKINLDLLYEDFKKELNNDTTKILTELSNQLYLLYTTFSQFLPSLSFFYSSKL